MARPPLPESRSSGPSPPSGEFLRGEVALDRELGRAWSQVLAQNQDVRAHRPQIQNCLFHFLLPLSQAQQEGGFGDCVRGEFFYRLKDC